MANLVVKDGNAVAKYLKQSGAGTDLDPHIPEHLETNSGDALTALQAIEAAVEGTLTVSGSVTVSSAPTTAITAAALPLPSGAATAAAQTTQTGHLATLAGTVADGQVQADIVAALPAGDNNIGDVDIASIAAGENLIGLVGTADVLLESTPTLDTAAHTAGDVLVAETEIANAVRVSGGRVVLNTLLIVDKDDQGAALTVHFFDRTVTFGTRNNAPSISDADAGYFMGHVDVAAADYKDLGGVKVATLKSIALGPIKANATSLYYAAVTNGTPTHTASGLVFKFGFMQA